MKTSTYQKLNMDITVMVDEAKRRNGFADKDIAKRLGMATGSVKNARSQKTMVKFPIWRIFLIADLAGYQVKFVKKGESS